MLRPISNDDLQIDEFSVASATTKGENYCGGIFRIIVKKERALEKRLIMKKSHTDETAKALFAKPDLYRKEINVYRSYLPEFQKILRSIEEDVKLAPEAIYYDLEKEVLVLEDLHVRGYRTIDKGVRFSVDLRGWH